MSPRPRRRARALAVLVVGAVATAVLSSLAPVATPNAAAADSDAPVLTVGALSPDVAQPGGTLRVSGTVKAGAEQLDSGIVRVRVGTAPIGLRAQLADIAGGDRHELAELLVAVRTLRGLRRRRRARRLPRPGGQ